MPNSTTIIAALKYQGGVVIAADTQASDMTAVVRWPVEKLDRLPNHPCVIGFSGSEGKAKVARQRLAEKGIHSTTFGKTGLIQTAITGVLTPIYKSIQEENHPPRVDVAGIALWGLIAIWAENDARILEFEINGASCFHDHFHVIGSGAPTAYAIYRTLGGRRLSSLDQARATMAILRILRTSIGVEMWGVGEPLDAWIVNGEATKRLGKDEIQVHLQAVDEWEEEEKAFLFRPG